MTVLRLWRRRYERITERDLARIAEVARFSDEDLDRLAARLAPGPSAVRQRIALAVGLLLIAGASVAVGATTVPPVRASVEIPGERGIGRIHVTGASRAARLQVRGQSVGVVVSPNTGEPFVRRTLLLSLPVPGVDCARLARQLGGGCDRPTGTGRAYDTLELRSGTRLGVTLTADLAGPVDVDGNGPKVLTIAPDATTSEVRVRCESPLQHLSLLLDDRRVALPTACGSRLRRALWLRLESKGDPRAVTLEAPRLLRVDLPGTSAALSVLEATAYADGRPAVIREPRAVEIAMHARASGQGFQLITGLDQSVSRFSAESTTSLFAPVVGQQVDTLLERGQEAWLLFGGAILALACTLLSEAYLIRRT
ncbi:MAG TPA: hypothetical protein VF533_16850 [Solirubrobacteraceae bacterium]